MRAFLLTLLIATSALAQPVVGPEVRSTPIEALDDYDIAPQHDGFVLAWTAGGRLYTGHLDATLHLTGAPFLIPLVDPRTAAVTPAIASDGTSVMVAWHERRTGFAEFAYVAVLSPDADKYLAGAQEINITKAAPLLTGVDGKYVIYTGDLRYVLNEKIGFESGVFISHKLAAALSRTGDVGTVDVNAPNVACPRSGFFPYTPCSANATVTFTCGASSASVLYSLSIPAGTTSSANPMPLIGPNGAACVGVTRLLTGTEFLFIGSNTKATSSIVLRSIGEPALAGNGNDVLLVWTSPAFMGLVVGPDGTAAPFPIADAGRQPKVVATTSNDFVVAYRIDVDPQHSVLAGRLIHLQPERRRAIR